MLLNQVIVSLILSQIALIGLFVRDVRGDSFSLNQVISIQRASLDEGSKLPVVSVYNRDGRRENLLIGCKPTTLIFCGCECQAGRLREVAVAAWKRGENVDFVVQRSPYQLDEFKERYQVPGRLLSVRTSELNTMIGLQNLPVIVHVSAKNIIYAVDY